MMIKLYYFRPVHREERFEEEVLEEDGAEVNLSKLDEEILEVTMLTTPVNASM